MLSKLLPMPDGTVLNTRAVIPGHALGELLKGLGLYEFCTENVAAYLPHLDPAGKRCLTVAASGDQVINLLLAGAREVVMFDCVAEAAFVAELKMHALVAHRGGREDFRARFTDCLEPEAYVRFQDRMSDAAGAFWLNIMAALPAGPRNRVFKPHQVTGRNAYIRSDEEFQAAQRAVAAALAEKRVSFVQAEARDLPLMPHLGSFDVIVLSNILGTVFSRHHQKPVPLSDWRRSWTTCGEDTLRALVRGMVWPLAGLLTPGGVMLADYVYAADYEDDDPDFEPDRNPLNANAARRRAFAPPPGFTVEEHRDECLNSECAGDDVMVLVRRDWA